MKKPSTLGTAVKIFVALLFVIMAFDMEGDTVAVSLVIGFAFLAWAVLPHRRYKQEIEETRNGRSSPVKKPGIGAMIAKVTAAALFIIMAFDMDDISSLLISLLLGAVFLFWAYYPFLHYKQALQTESVSLQTSVQAPVESNHKVRRRPCPYCGAPMTGDTCEYCGMYSEE